MSRFSQIAAPTRKPYISDLSDRERELIKPWLPTHKGFGHPRNVDLKRVQIENWSFETKESGARSQELDVSGSKY